MSKLARIATSPFIMADLNTWGERPLIPVDIDSEIIQTQQEFSDIGISGEKIENLSVSKLTAGTLSVNTSIQSSNYVPGVSGFYLDSGTGNVEFNSGTFRGNLTAGSIDIPDTVTANSFHVDNMGNAWWGATTLGSAIAYVKKDGSALFQTGLIGGFTIGATTLTASNLIIDSANQQITIGSGLNQIIIDGSTGTISNTGGDFTLNGNGTVSGFGTRVGVSTTNVQIGPSDSTEQTVYSFTIPGGTLDVSNAIKMTVYCGGFNGGGGGSGTFFLKYGGTTIASSTASVTTNATGYITCYVMGAGATNSQEGSFVADLTVVGGGAAQSDFRVSNFGSAGVDSTTDQTLSLTFQFSVSSVSNVINFYHAVVEKII